MPDRVSGIQTPINQEKLVVLTASTLLSSLVAFYLASLPQFTISLSFLSFSFFLALKWLAKYHMIILDLSNFGRLATISG